MPLVPREMMRDRPPVRRSRWNFSDSACRWRKVRMASSRTAACPTLAKSASRNCANSHHHDAAEAIGEHQGDGHRQEQDCRRRLVSGHWPVEGIDGVFEGERRGDRDHLGDDERQESENDARLEIEPAGRPQIGQNGLQGRKRIAVARAAGGAGLHAQALHGDPSQRKRRWPMATTGIILDRLYSAGSNPTLGPAAGSFAKR